MFCQRRKQRYVGRRCLPAAAMGACSNANMSFTQIESFAFERLRPCACG